MIDDVVEQYKKYGWVLRRILLTVAEHKAKSPELKSRYPDASLSEGEVDALWFSRRRGNDETWELRRLSGSPFALLQVFENRVTDDERESTLRNIEKRMAETLTKSDREITLEM